MFGIINFEAFAITALFLILMPGTDTFYILGKSMSEGKKAGILSALGIGTGSFLHTLFAALGLSVILAESAFAFSVVKYVGAIYLVYLGIQSLLEKRKPNNKELSSPMKDRSKNVFLSGVLTNVLNPKIALFYLAFLPQFIDPNYSNQVISFLVLGSTFTFFGTLYCLFLGIFAAKMTAKFQGDSSVGFFLNKFAGALFVILGIKVAFSE